MSDGIHNPRKESKMDTGMISNVVQSAVTPAASSAAKKTEEKAEEKSTSKSGFSEKAATYEKSDDAATVKNDRSAMVEKLKADAEQRQQQLIGIVQKMMAGQGKAIGTADDMWKFLASGDFTVDPETKAQAQKDIADDGYWGVNQTSDRIVDFAIALSGGDADKADKMIEAFKKGFDEATKSWGKELPDISKRTYDAVLEKMDAWKQGTYKSGASTATE